MPQALRGWHFIAACLIWLLAACVNPADKLTLDPTSYSALNGWEQDDLTQALYAFQASCAEILRKSPEAIIGKGIIAAPAALWQSTCHQAVLTDAADARAFFEARFIPYMAGNRGKQTGLFTGYYEPLLSGSHTPDTRYAFPVYGMPLDSFLSHATRAEIDAGALIGRGLAIAWVDDPVGLFFAQIQGSARIALPDGSMMRIGYAGNNGQPYVALGKVLIESGALTADSVNFFTIRNWLITHPEQAAAVMEQNPSYVFFREVVGDGPVGAEKIVLSPARSLAVDHRFIPYGMPLFLMTSLPETAYSPAQAFQHLMIAQDTGGAIRGPVRGDIFFGSGPQAEALAGVLKAQGGYALLLPKSVAEALP